MNKSNKLLLSLSIIGAGLLVTLIVIYFNKPERKQFDGDRAYQNVEYQLELGPRVPGSEAHNKAVNWILTAMQSSGWQTELQEGEKQGYTIRNIIGKKGSGAPWIIIGSHYDSRKYADRDASAEGRGQPVPGANDGASSVAILLELARILPNKLEKQIWLVFFDVEDVSSNEIAIGSQYFVDNLSSKPDSVVILDMVGDKDLNIYKEWNSNPELNQDIWDVASDLGYTQFVPVYKRAILDDHIPFIEAGIQAVDIIDFDYPYWHTTQDTLDKISAESLAVVGKTIYQWLEQNPQK